MLVDTVFDDADNSEKNDPVNMESDDAAKSEKGSLLYSTQPDKLKKTESGRIASGVVKKRETSGKDEPVYMASDDTEKSEKVSVLTLYHTKTH